jgi:sec-independent protein translocase protein TatA
MGMPELLIILAVALLIFGPKNLPKLGSALGKTVKSLRDGMGGGKAEEDDDDEEIEEIAEEAKEKPARKPAAQKTSKPAPEKKSSKK